MEGKIVNRVAKSKLVTIELDDLYPEGKRTILDISQWLFQGLVVREKEFRSQLQDHDWEQYKDDYVVLTCSTDAIIPGWAYLLITTYLQPYAKFVVQGSIADLDNLLMEQAINELEVSEYEGKSVIIAGCSNKLIHETSYLLIIQKLMTVARTILFGEACSTVPLFRNRK